MGVGQCLLYHLHFPPQTPCTDGASFSCVKPVLGRLTQETRACGLVWRVLTAVTTLASVEQHGPRREDDGIGHGNDGLPVASQLTLQSASWKPFPTNPKSSM